MLSQGYFDSQSSIFRLVSEAYRISLVYVFEPYLAIHSSLIDPLPHQISAVYERMLPQQPLRFVLADDPGAGKTIMAGLFIKELFLRGNIRRCLIVCPGTLVEQWQDELQFKFLLNFEILTGEKINSAVNGNIFSSVNRCIVSIDILSRNKAFQGKLKTTSWDLIICDEAHKMSATLTGNKIHRTKRFRLGQLLGKITRHFLLMTATPHNGIKENFNLFMSLIDPDRFEGIRRIKNSVDVSDIMRRLIKEDLRTFDNKPLFPERRTYTVNYKLSPKELKLYELVTEYVSENFNMAERLTSDKKVSVGFAMTILQRRLASSPKAIYQSLARRLERLTHILNKKKYKVDEKKILDIDEFFDDEEFPSGDFETKENVLAENVTTARTLNELRNEIQTLQYLTDFAKKIFISGEDRKWIELSELLQSNDKFLNSAGERDKIIIFTEHRDTLDYLQQKISTLFGRNEAVVVIHGGISHSERRKIQERFKVNKNVFVLVATDAAGEGINLQNAHLMINYDLPWNPNRLEQRFGRIHRIGQKNICHMWNLVASGTREGQVFQRLLKKLDEERAALGGKVFDILGKISFDNKPLRDLLIEAVRFGNNPNVTQHLNNMVDESFDTEKIHKLLQERALTADTLNFEKVATITQNMARAETSKLQPYYIENFFIEAFQKSFGEIDYRGNGYYEISRVPNAIRNQFQQNNLGESVKGSYKRICFSKDKFNGAESAELVTFGHPLLKALTLHILEKFGDVLRKGSILIDDNAEKFKVLFYVESKIFDGCENVLSKRVHFVEIFEDGNVKLNSSHAPYLNYRSPSDGERQKILSIIPTLSWLKADIEKSAVNYVEKNFSEPLRQKFSAQKKLDLDKLEVEVKSRLRSEINYWDDQADELRAKDELNAKQATKRADELYERLKSRLAEIKLQRQIFSATPIITGAALIAPADYFESNGTQIFSDDVDSRSIIEDIAMNAVMKIERELGNIPSDVSADNRGYDIESLTPENHLRFIEVKGRNATADTVTVTKNEIMTALNAPEEFILAIVSINGNSSHVTYLQSPFTTAPDLNAISVNYKISSLIRQGKILFEN